MDAATQLRIVLHQNTVCGRMKASNFQRRVPRGLWSIEHARSDRLAMPGVADAIVAGRLRQGRARGSDLLPCY